MRHEHGTSFSWRGVFGTRATGMAIAVLAQLLSTYMPLAHLVFESRPLGPGTAPLMVAARVLLTSMVEDKKTFVRRWTGASA